MIEVSGAAALALRRTRDANRLGRHAVARLHLSPSGDVVVSFVERVRPDGRRISMAGCHLFVDPELDRTQTGVLDLEAIDGHRSFVLLRRTAPLTGAD